MDPRDLLKCLSGLTDTLNFCEIEFGYARDEMSDEEYYEFVKARMFWIRKVSAAVEGLWDTFDERQGYTH